MAYNNYSVKRLLLALFFTATAASAADLDLVRQNFIAYTAAAGANASTQRMSDALGALEASARSYTAPGFLLSDGSWSDINYGELPSGSWSPWDHVRRLTVMAKAYKTPGQALYGDPLLLTQIRSALSYVSVFYGPTRWPLGNWWFWTIGIPLDLGPTLVLMRGDIDAKTYSDCVKDIAIRIGPSASSKGIVGPAPTGENLVWSSYTHLYLGLLKDDPAMLASVRDAMASVSLPTAGDGIQSDASFHQHGPQLYTGGYGGSFASDVARYMLLTRDTLYALPPAATDAFADYVADGIAWSLYGNYFDVSVVGRYVARSSTTGIDGVAALLQSSSVPSPRQVEIRSRAAQMLRSWTWTLPVELAGLAANVEASGAVASWPDGHRHYYLSDYTIHRRPGWFASIKMFSTRTKSGENTNNENILGARQSDGRMYLVLDGGEYFGRDVWPALDWTRLPGTTVEQKADTANAAYGYGTKSFVGGTTDGRDGVSAMDFAALNSSLSAKKSWFFFDDAIVFLSTSITSPSANRVETIVNQWPLMNAASQLQLGGTPSATRWAWCENVGYVFPLPVALQSKREIRSGTWASLGGSTDTTPRSADVVTLWIDHGAAPVNAAAEYIVLPNATVSTTAAWSAFNPISILQNDGEVSAVRDTRTNALGIVFWKPFGVMEGIASDSAAIVYKTGDAARMQLWISDPTNGNGTAHITVPGLYTTADVPYTTIGRSTTIDVPRSAGVTVHVTLTALAARKRSARH